jgi:hypothetical protein
VLGDRGQRQRIARADDRRRRLDEQLGDDDVLVDALAAAFLDVLLEVAGDADQLARPLDRRDQIDGRNGLALVAAGRDLARLVEGSFAGLEDPPDASARSTT